LSVRHSVLTALLAVFLCVLNTMAHAQDAPLLNSGNTAWMLTATALVLLMTLPGLALFYGGLVQSKNVLSVMAHCFAIAAGVSLLWAIGAYSLVFSGDGAYLGDTKRFFLGTLDSVYGSTGIPESVFVMYQMTFAIITPALIIGTFPERVKFGFVLAFSLLWLLVVYVPVAHWVWGNGWLAKLNVIDFAGGIVVHTTAGAAALVAAVMIGSRQGFPNHVLPPHNPGMTITGAALLWIGWFGFNAGSALAADGSAGNAMLATHLSASAAAITWMITEWVRFGKPSSVGVVTGLVAGLATITPAAGHTGPMGAIAIGIASGIICFLSVRQIKVKWRIDDSLDVFGVHGVGGMLGSILVAFTALPSLGGRGLAEGMTVFSQLSVQAIAVGVTAIFSGFFTFVIITLLPTISATQEDQSDGLDLSEHGERAYDLK
jgi:ammonium transporter, Amt family